MKKFALIGLALCMVFAFSAPAMALDVDFSGFYRVRGFCYHDYETFGDNTYNGEREHASDYMDMLLDVNIVFKVHPKLKLVTNFTALDKVWGTTDVGPGMDEDTRNIDWNRAYMEFTTDIGMFKIGRMTGGAWNHAFINSTYEADRIQYILPPKAWGGPSWMPLLFTYTFQKTNERDANKWYGNLSDEDQDMHSWTLGYFSSNVIVDYLLVFNREEGSFVADIGFGPVWRQKQDTWTHCLHSMFKIGPVQIDSEFAYTHGYITDLSGWVWVFGNGDDVEIDAMAWFVQAAFDGGPFDVYAGWAHTDGDADGAVDVFFPGNTINSYSGQQGNDWDLLFFLTSDEGTHASNFGGIGNWSAEGANPYGLDLLYIGGGFDITPTVNVSGLWGLAWADAVPTGSKDIGHELNIWLTWQIMDGLQYKALFAFFNAGDFWEDASNYAFNAHPLLGGAYMQTHDNVSEDGSAWALMHQLTLSF